MQPFSFPLSVGVTGHRSFAAEHLPRIETHIRTVLQALKDSAYAIIKESDEMFSPEPIMRVISCLSDGADRIVAKEGRDHGYRLSAVIPFPKNSPVHERDLGGTEKEAALSDFYELLDLAESVLELDPEYIGEEHGETAQATQQRQSAYCEAGLRMLEHSDLLLAIWHGEPQPRIGSTSDMVDTAYKKGMPIIWINSNSDVSPRLWYCDENGEKQDVSIDPVNPAPALLRVMKLFFGMPGLNSSAGVRSEVGSEALRRIKICLQDTSSSDQKLYTPSWLLWWDKFHRYLSGRTPRKDPTIPKQQDNETFRDSLSRLANYYGQIHRSFFLLACLLGATAVTLAALAAVISSAWIRIGLGVAEICVLTLVYYHYYLSRKYEWQRKLTDYRLLTEYMRHLDYLSPLGRCLSAMHALPYYSGGVDVWIRWLMRVIMRSDGIVSQSFTDKAALDQLRERLSQQWLNGQVQYHLSNANNSLKTLNRLHCFSNVMFWVTCICVIFHVVLDMAGYHIFIISEALTFAAIICPLWGITAHSLCHYAELRRLSNRSKAMEDNLARLRDQMKAASRAEDMGLIAAGAANLMMQEAVDWKIQYNMPAIALA